jgi:hypothetical protein
MMRPTLAWGLLIGSAVPAAVVACGGVDAGAASDAVLHCGPSSCAIATGVYCAICPIAGRYFPTCGVEPPDDEKNDLWQYSVACGPQVRGDVPWFACDSHDDCAPDDWCAAWPQVHGAQYARCEPRRADAQACLGDGPGPVCRRLADCPSCATACELIDEPGQPFRGAFPLGLCR